MEKKKPTNILSKPGCSATTDYACKRCTRNFASLPECLKHELLEHSLAKSRSQKSVRNQLQSVLKTFKEADMQQMQSQVQTALKACHAGEELKTILQLHTIDTKKLEQSYLHIYTCLHKELQKIGNFTIHPFGSVANGLALKSSDIDIYIDIDDYSDHTNKHFSVVFKRVSSFLYRSDCFSDVCPIRQARVPIIKCKHVPSGFHIDINMSCPSSVNNTNFLRDIVRSDSRLHQLLLFLKIWSKHLQIIGRGSNMSSYCLITLVIFYLQNTPNSKEITAQPILPSLEQLQSRTPPEIVEGVNYAYNLQCIVPLSKHHTVRSLLEGFFQYYHNFDFRLNIISPFLGHAILREHFIANDYKFSTYLDQLRAISILKGVAAMPLQVQHSMCVQDIFCLNLNVARTVAPAHFEYFSLCLKSAAFFCKADAEVRVPDAQFYNQLLYGIIDELSKIEIPNNSPSLTTTSVLSFTISPSRIEMRDLVMHAENLEYKKSFVYKMWVQLYTEIIKEILTDIYKLDVQQALPTQCLKNQKLDNSELTHTWVLSGSVDMWTERIFEGKNSLRFMKHQKMLTEKFQQQRRQNSAYAVEMSVILKLKISTDFSAIEITIQPSEDVGKRNPVRKFFGNFKNALQSFNLKEKLLSSHNVSAETASTKLMKGLEKNDVILENGQADKNDITQ